MRTHSSDTSPKLQTSPVHAPHRPHDGVVEELARIVRGDAKIGQLDPAGRRDEDVPGFDVKVERIFVVEVGQSPQRLEGNRRRGPLRHRDDFAGGFQSRLLEPLTTAAGTVISEFFW